MTTTGATVLVGLDALPPSINVWRAMLQWLGGMGVVVLAVAVLPMLGVGGRQLFRAETPGPMKDAGAMRLCELLRLDRGRYQDDPGAAAVAAYGEVA